MKFIVGIINTHKEKQMENPVNYLSTGIPLLDLTLGGGYPIGKIVNLVGDKSTGKSLLACECIVEAKKKLGDKLIWRYDDAEEGFSFPTEQMYGFRIDNPEEDNSFTIEDFEYNLTKALNAKKENETLIYVLDSFDALSSEEEVERHKTRQKAMQKAFQEGSEYEAESKGYNLGKQRAFGELLRILKGKINKEKCLLIIISQVRNNIGVMFGEKYYRTGGKALDHYAAQINWMAQTEILENKKGVPFGVTLKLKNKKNKVGCPFKESFFEVLFNYGVDNISTNLNYLYDIYTDAGKKTNSSKKNFVWEDKAFKSIEDLVFHIEKNNKEEELTNKVYIKFETDNKTNNNERKRK